MTIREYADSCGHRIAGDLVRRTDIERFGYAVYTDDAGTMYLSGNGQVIIGLTNGLVL